MPNISSTQPVLETSPSALLSAQSSNMVTKSPISEISMQADPSVAVHSRATPARKPRLTKAAYIGPPPLTIAYITGAEGILKYARRIADSKMPDLRKRLMLAEILPHMAEAVEDRSSDEESRVGLQKCIEEYHHGVEGEAEIVKRAERRREQVVNSKMGLKFTSSAEGLERRRRMQVRAVEEGKADC